MIVSAPFPISHGSDALARQSESIGMKHVAQQAQANVGSASLGATVVVTSSSLGWEDGTEGSHLTCTGMGSLEVAFEDCVVC